VFCVLYGFVLFCVLLLHRMAIDKLLAKYMHMVSLIACVYGQLHSQYVFILCLFTP